jgi:ATP-dependent Clp protease adaptor protein ClpS
MSASNHLHDLGGSPLRQEETEVLEDITGGWSVVVYNDDVNTFDHVIYCLEKYCDHTAEQAEQCSLIIHFKGQCAVKHGGVDELSPICDALCGKGLSALLEEIA